MGIGGDAQAFLLDTLTGLSKQGGMARAGQAFELVFESCQHHVIPVIEPERRALYSAFGARCHFGSDHRPGLPRPAACSLAAREPATGLLSVWPFGWGLVAEGRSGRLLSAVVLALSPAVFMLSEMRLRAASTSSTRTCTIWPLLTMVCGSLTK